MVIHHEDRTASRHRDDRAPWAGSSPTDLAEPELAPFDDPLYAEAWTSAAIAIHSIALIDAPMVLRLHVDEHAPLIIDFRTGAFSWARPLSRFPGHPRRVEVETECVTATAPSPVEPPGADLDRLLWLIGGHSFQGHPASWLTPGQRHRLARWPNLTRHAHAPDQVRMTAMLAASAFTAAELAAGADTDVIDAQRLINTYSLMGILREGVDAEAAPVLPRPSSETSARGGLFQRLRDRWSPR